MSSDELLLRGSRRGPSGPTTISGTLAARRQQGQTERHTAHTAGALERQLVEEESDAILRSTREGYRNQRARQTIAHIGDEVALAASYAAEVPAAAPHLWRYLSAVNATRVDEELHG